MQESNTITKSETTTEDLTSLSLDALASRLNERERSIQITRQMVIDKAAWTVKRAMEQGRDLLEVRNRLSKDGTWMLWLKANCPFIHYVTANRYIRAYERFNTVINGCVDSKTLTQLYIEAGLLPPPVSKDAVEAPEQTQSHRGPAPVEWMGKAFVWLQKHGGVEGIEPEARKPLKEAIKPWVEIYPLL